MEIYSINLNTLKYKELMKMWIDSELITEALWLFVGFFGMGFSLGLGIACGLAFRKYKSY